MEINLAYYRKQDWRKFLEMIDDRDSMHDTWKEWHKSYLIAKRNLTFFFFFSGHLRRRLIPKPLLIN